MKGKGKADSLNCTRASAGSEVSQPTSALSKSGVAVMLAMTGGTVSTTASTRTTRPAEASKYSAEMASPFRVRNWPGAGGFVSETKVIHPRNKPGSTVSASVTVWLFVIA